jgi:transcriptional regulator with XRE-family HTH domain
LRAGLTQEKLAEPAGLSVRSISTIERGRINRPRADSLERLAGALALAGTARDEFIDHYRGRSAPVPNLLPVRQHRFTGRVPT